MIDFHSHILPGIDDGSRDLSQSAQMIEAEMADGVDTIIATPHFYADRAKEEAYLKKRKSCEEELRGYLEGLKQAPKLLVGAEVCYFPGMGKAKLLDSLCIEGTRTLLLEMPFAQWTDQNYDDVVELLLKRKFNVILAHVERYPEFQKKKDVWRDVMELPLTKQINAGSLIKKGLFDKKYRFCMNVLREHEHVLLGTDCHNMTGRKPNLLAGRQAVEKQLGKERLESIDAWGKSLLTLI